MCEVLHRRQHGSQLLEGAAFLIIAVPVFAGLLLLIVAAGTIYNYQMKLQNIATIAARNVANDTFWEGAMRGPKPTALSPAQTLMVSNILAQMGLPSSVNNFSTSVSDDTFNCIVTLRVSALPVMALPGIIPNAVSLAATAAYPWSIGHPRFGVFIGSSAGQVRVPAYPPPPIGLPNVASVTAPAIVRDNPSLVDTNGWPSAVYVFSPQAGAQPYQQYKVNYDGYGVSAPSGAGTDTGSNLCAYSPWYGSAPSAPPTNSQYPSP